MKRHISIITAVTLAFSAHADFNDWKQRFYRKAQNSGVSAPLLQQFMATAVPYERAVQSDRSQAEFKKFLWDYLSSAVSDNRVRNGQQKFGENQLLLSEIATQTGVSPQIIAAIWGMETNYGSYTGKVPIVSALSTLAYEGRRKAFFEGELLALLKLIERGDVPDIDVLGSWAGGMGLTQFIPTTYARYAVDYNGDGRRNLWQKPDALASTAHYLKKMGWQSGYRWGREVTVPDGFDYFLANDNKQWKPLSAWKALGITTVYGQPLPDESIPARLFVPAGQFGPKFLLYKNFNVIKRYNNSDAYALGVSLLSDRIAGKPPLVTAWPNNAKKLTKNDIKLVQTALNAYGFSAGKVDGIFGNGTRRALQAYQAANGKVADGFLSIDLYRQLITGY